MEIAQRYRGCLLGLAVGDAVGAALEFKQPGSFSPITDMIGGGPFRLAPGQWTDDTSMALCLAESLLEKQGFDAIDQLERYVRWWKEGHFSSTGRCFDIGNATRAALDRFIRTRRPYCGSTDPYMAGNGSIMRLAPVPMFFANDPVRAIEMAAESSRTTHGTSAAIEACRYFAALIVAALQGATKQEILSDFYCPIPDYWEAHPLMPDIHEIASGSFRKKEPPAIKGSGYVVRSLEAALWAFHKSDNFRDGCLLAANLGDDADTTAAVYGQLAGAFYGEQGIPLPWREKVAMRETITALADRLCAASRKPSGQKTDIRSVARSAIKEQSVPVPLERSYWVVPGKFLAGAYPGDVVPERAEQKIRALLSAGIRCVVDLTEKRDRNLAGLPVIHYEEFLNSVATKERLEVSYHRNSITDLDVPSRDQMREILDLIDSAIGSDRPVYVHCLGGIGRTGTVVGCWLSRHGVGRGNAVLELIRKLRRNEKQAHIESPETAQQRRFVCDWKEGD
jgi:ADP-ribosylglycohydrolase